MSQAPASRVTDQFAHSSALPGALIGLAVGIAAGAFILATGGLGAIAIGAALGVAGGAGLAGEAIGATMMGPSTGALLSGSPNVLTNMLPQGATVIALGPCSMESGVPQAVATGAETVLINMMPAARKGETMTCSAQLMSGSPNVLIGGASVQVLPIEPEVPQWLNNTMLAMTIGGGVIAFGGMVATYGIVVATGSFLGGTAGSYLLGTGAEWAAAKMGYGKTGQTIAGVAGGFVGGAIGGSLAFRGTSAAMVASRRATAQAFYAKQGWPQSRIDSHMKGIDFTRPVSVVDIDRGTPLSQWQVPGGPKGNYFAPAAESPSRLGISPVGHDPAVGAVSKTQTGYTANQTTPALKTTAAAVDDTWSSPYATAQTHGGGTQYFVPDPGAFGP